MQNIGVVADIKCGVAAEWWRKHKRNYCLEHKVCVINLCVWVLKMHKSLRYNEYDESEPTTPTDEFLHLFNFTVEPYL